MNSVAASCLYFAAGVMMLPVASAGGNENAPTEIRFPLLLAEIVGPGTPAQSDPGSKASKSAAEARLKARTYQESGASAPVIIVAPQEEEEEGMLGPRGQPGGAASQNRDRARRYQQGQGSVLIPAPAQTSGGQGATSADRASENRNRARSYVATDNTIVIQRMGSDGIPIVSCGKLVANESGRIGDDAQPGGVFVIMRDNKPFKVRCAPQ